MGSGRWVMTQVMPGVVMGGGRWVMTQVMPGVEVVVGELPCWQYRACDSLITSCHEDKIIRSSPTAPG